MNQINEQEQMMFSRPYARQFRIRIMTQKVAGKVIACVVTLYKRVSDSHSFVMYDLLGIG
jgi:hypothetical protein